jgi:hypothetical protein
VKRLLKVQNLAALLAMALDQVAPHLPIERHLHSVFDGQRAAFHEEVVRVSRRRGRA